MANELAVLSAESRYPSADLEVPAHEPAKGIGVYDFCSARNVIYMPPCALSFFSYRNISPHSYE